MTKPHENKKPASSVYLIGGMEFVVMPVYTASESIIYPLIQLLKRDVQARENMVEWKQQNSARSTAGKEER